MDLIGSGVAWASSCRIPSRSCGSRSKDQAGEWRNGTSFGLSDLETLVTVAHQATEWMAAHAVKR